MSLMKVVASHLLFQVLYVHDFHLQLSRGWKNAAAVTVLHLYSPLTICPSVC